MGPHPRFEEWLGNNPLDVSSKTALVVGCGLGDDAIVLESKGYDVTAFDVSETAIELCRKRFPQSKVRFLQANLFDEQPEWNAQFDFVLEVYTVQALPPKYESELIRRISDFVAPGGQLLVIACVVDEPRAFENGPPWKLTPQHVTAFKSCGLSLVGQAILEDPVDGDSAYTSLFRKPAR
jgi:SAM-dependent methyltransferase